DPCVSVLLPVHNARRYIRAAVYSVLQQTFKDFECIIVNDGSTDGTLEILQDLAERNPCIVLITRENRGLVASLNEAIAVARGKYLARMDADDLCLPARF